MFGQELQFKVFFVVASLTETVQNFSQWNIFDSTTIRARKTRISTGKRGKNAKSYARFEQKIHVHPRTKTCVVFSPLRTL